LNNKRVVFEAYKVTGYPVTETLAMPNVERIYAQSFTAYAQCRLTCTYIVKLWAIVRVHTVFQSRSLLEVRGINELESHRLQRLAYSA
jgi:hypothetical protein